MVLLSGRFEVVGVVKLWVLSAKVVGLPCTTVVTVRMLVLSTVVVVLSRRVVVVVSGIGASSETLFSIGTSSEPLFTSMKGRLVTLRVNGVW